MNALTAELLRCPECHTEKSTARTLGLTDDREITCPNCKSVNSLGLWRNQSIAEEIEAVATKTVVDTIAYPDFIDVVSEKPTLNHKIKKVDSGVPSVLRVIVVGIVVWIAVLVGIAFGIVAFFGWAGTFIHLIDNRTYSELHRFKDDNAYGAAANALESLQYEVIFFKCLVVALLFTFATNWIFNKVGVLSRSAQK